MRKFSQNIRIRNITYSVKSDIFMFSQIANRLKIEKQK